jgi:hypothetical protein
MGVDFRRVTQVASTKINGISLLGLRMRYNVLQIALTVTQVIVQINDFGLLSDRPFFLLKPQPSINAV